MHRSCEVGIAIIGKEDAYRSELASWLREAVSEGCVSAALEGDFPRYAWKRFGDQVYEARLSNSGLGQYKGYPIKDYEAPGWL